jgi:hypothetical protein
MIFFSFPARQQSKGAMAGQEFHFTSMHNIEWEEQRRGGHW